MPKPLNIAMLGCGFMGRAHSNAWLQVNHFFPREHQPVLKVCVAFGSEALQLGVPILAEELERREP